MLFAPTAPAKRAVAYAIPAILVLAVFIWLALLPGGIAFPLDDAYVTLHNATVVLSGVDRNFAGVPALVGATSPVHLALIAGLMLLIPAGSASQVVGCLAAMAYAAGLVRLALQHGASLTLALITAGIGLLAGYAPYHLSNGLETGMAMAAVTWSLVLAAHPGPSRWLALLCGVMPFIRPELGLLSLLLMARQWLLRWRQEGLDRPARKRAAAVASDCAIDLGLLVATAAPWLLWCWLDTGSVIASTASAKAAFFAEMDLSFGRKLALLAGGIAAAHLLPLWLWLLLLRRARLAAWLQIFTAAFFLSYFVAFPGGIWQNFFRYQLILLPIFCYAMLALLRQWRGSMLFRGLLAACVVYVAIGLPGRWADLEGGRQRTLDALVPVAAWMREHLPADARILIHDAGYVAFATPFSLVDAVGLKTRESIAEHRRWTLPSGGQDLGIALDHIVRRFDTGYAVLLDDGGFWSRMATALRRQGYALTVLRKPAGIPGYYVYRLEPPAGPASPP
jgi:hypothetical protein